MDTNQTNKIDSSSRFNVQKALWKDWKDNDNSVARENLVSSLEPFIWKEVNKYKNAPLPTNAIAAEAYRLTGSAIDTYDPNAGAAVGTHVGNYLKKLYRFVGEHQNVGRIPEQKIMMISKYNQAVADLQDTLDREPDSDEIAAKMQVPHSQVKDLMKMVRSDFSLHVDIPTEEESAIVKHYTPKDIMAMAEGDMDRDEFSVYQKLMEGESPAVIAETSGKSIRWVNKIRESIADKIKENISKL